MEVKKSPKADLEKKKGIFLQIGLIVTLGVIWMAFEWTSNPDKGSAFETAKAQEVEEEIIPITERAKPKPPPPPPPPAMSTELNIVEDDVEIEDEFIAEDVEADQDTEVEMIEMDEEEEEEEEQIYVVAETMPTFKGGNLNDFRNWVQKRLRYPTIAQENGIQGTVYLMFVVDQSGRVAKCEIQRGVDPLIDKEAKRVVMKSPKWTPGEQRGKKVKVKFSLPVKFRLE